jgi:hypothetical protein
MPWDPYLLEHTNFHNHNMGIVHVLLRAKPGRLLPRAQTLNGLYRGPCVSAYRPCYSLVFEVLCGGV